MKYLYLSIFTALMCLCCERVSAQCPTGNIILDSQQDINDFVAQYPNCTELEGNVYISSSAVNDLSPLAQITSMDKGLYIRDTHVTDLTGLNNLTSVSRLYIGGNDSLTNLIGLESLNTASSVLIGDYTIETFLPNNALTSLTGLNLTSVEELMIAANPVLTDLTNLSTLTSIRNFIIYENSSLVNLNGLENLSSIEHLTILANASLTDLTALDNLTLVASELYIAHNDKLSSLSGLQNIDFSELMDYNGFINLGIFKNPMLSVCSLPNICTYLENGGTSRIHDNAPDCNTAEEILALCIVSTSTPDDQLITISPNPSSGTFTLQGIPKGTYQILNTSGQIIQEGELKNDISLDISAEAQGVYFISVTIDDETFVKRIIKM